MAILFVSCTLKTDCDHLKSENKLLKQKLDSLSLIVLLAAMSDEEAGALEACGNLSSDEGVLKCFKFYYHRDNPNWTLGDIRVERLDNRTFYIHYESRPNEWSEFNPYAISLSINADGTYRFY
jgi:hypothetical protein